MPRRPSRIFLTIAALFASALLALPSSARAQEPTAALQIQQVDGSAYPDVRAVVSALGEDGAPVAGLTSAAFQPFEGETPIGLASVAPASDPDQRLGVAIVIDVSANMQGAPLDIAKLAAVEFVRNLKPADEAAVFAFNDAVTSVVPFTLDRDELANGIAGLSAGGGARLFEAATAGMYAAGASVPDRKAVVLLTASRNTVPGITSAQPLEVARIARTPIFSVALGAGADDAFLSELAARTMGQHRAVAVDGAIAATREIANVLINQYVLTMTGAGSADGEIGELRIIADINGAPAGAVANFRRGPEPAGPTRAGDGGGGSWFGVAALAVLVTLAVVGAVAGAAYGGVRFVRDIRTARHQREVVAPNEQRAAAQPLPRPAGVLRTAAAMPAPALSPASVGAQAMIDASALGGPPEQQPNAVSPPPAPADAQPPVDAGSRSIGSFVEKTPQGRGKTYELGAGPIVIGSSARECTIVLPPSQDVAPAHVRIWLRDGKYVMHHAGGFRRRTLVGGQPTDWCVLEHGDEVQIGPHKLVYVEAGNERPLRF